MLRRSHTRELEQQIDCFESEYGKPPDFLDGHQHIHQMPFIRDVVLELWKHRLEGQAWIRCCWESPFRLIGRPSGIKALAIGAVGWRFRRELTARRVPFNRSFRGIYDFSNGVSFQQLFQSFIQRVTSSTLVMCHPGLVDDVLEASDSLTWQREVEYQFLASDAAGLALASSGIPLTQSPATPLLQD